MTRYIFDRLTGGQSLFLKVMFSYFSEASMVPSKPHEGGTSHFWMDGENEYPAVNSEKTIFMKCQGDDFIIHSLFVDDMMHIPTCDALKQA